MSFVRPLRALALAVLLVAPGSIRAQDTNAADRPGTAPQVAAPAPYKPVMVQPPAVFADAGLEAFRKQLIAIAAKKDRAALAKLVAPNFFWERVDGKPAPKRAAIDNLAAALDLGAVDGSGWEMLAALAADPTAGPAEGKPGTLCSPADPQFDNAAYEQLIKESGTDIFDWGYPDADGIEVREQPDAEAKVVEKLGLHFVRVYYDPQETDVSEDWLRVVTPSGKVGFVAADTLNAIGNDQLCYAKGGNTWRIAGYVGGGE
jgi:hypothetical protein